MRIGEVARASEAERAEIIKAVKERVARKAVDELENQDIGLVMGLAQVLERGGQTKLAAEVNREFGEQFATSSNPEIAGLGRMLQGVARRMDLVGNEMEIKGTLLDGSAFDWASYRGKVVLIDFWATWCGPCRVELPNVKKSFDQYHDQGFDVVGISLDRRRDDLEKFLATEKLPWVTLYEGDGVRNPNAEYYGIMGIPTVVLVGRDGKVVSLNARGPELGRLLRELIGPPSKPEPAADLAKPVSS
jgi:thiol-disulfide isomerase/thioredoxin